MGLLLGRKIHVLINEGVAGGRVSNELTVPRDDDGGFGGENTLHLSFSKREIYVLIRDRYQIYYLAGRWDVK